MGLASSNSVKAVMFVKQSGRIFAITFGYGKSLLNNWCWEKRFGLRVALGLVGTENLKAINKKDISKTPKSSIEQLSKSGSVADFSIETNTDFLNGVTGAPKDDSFGKTVTGKDSLTLWVKTDVTNIKVLLGKIYAEYISESYKENFEWIDNIAPVEDEKLKKHCQSKLLDKIQNEDRATVWMAIPEIVEWEKVDHFRFNKKKFGIDLDLEKYLGF